MASDFYQDLGVSSSATTDEIRKAYRKLAAQLHPDKNPGDKATEDRFKAVNRAYHVLTDPEKRKLYDEFGEEALREGFDAEAARAYRRGGFGRGASVEDLFGGAPGGFGDLFGDLFGARSARRRGGPRKGPDAVSEVVVDFASAVRGTELKLALQNGTKEITVRIPPGAADGDTLRVPGHGGEGMFGGPKGDLLLTVRVRPHPCFERDGLDLSLDLPITVAEAYYGGKVPVPTPTGTVTLTVPKHARSGQIARLRGKGVERQNQVGDLYVRFLIQLPTAESPEVARAIDQLQAASDEDVRAKIRF